METTKAAIENFLEEAVFLQDFHHLNVLPTLGVCLPAGTTPQVVLPYMANGDLRTLMRKESLVSVPPASLVLIHEVIMCHTLIQHRGAKNRTEFTTLTRTCITLL